MFGRRVRTTRVGSVGIAGHLDAHGPFVDDDDQHDLRRVGNGGEALSHLDRFETLRRAQPRRHVFDGLCFERHADAHVGEAPHLLVARRGVALNLDRGDRSRGVAPPRDQGRDGSEG